MSKFKKYLKSKTIWFGAVGVPAIMQVLLYAQANLSLVKDNLGTSYSLATFAIGLAVIILRLVTTKPIEDK